MSIGVPYLLIGAIVFFLVLILAVVGVIVTGKRQKRLQLRIINVTGSYARAATSSSSGHGRRRLIEAIQPSLQRLARLFGFTTVRLSEYPVRWWIVLVVALVMARMLAEVMSSLVGWIALPFVPLMWLMISRAFFGWCHARRSNRLYIQFPDALAMIVRGVRVGIPVSEAIRTVAREAMAPTNVEFQEIADQLSIGVALPDALRELSQRNQLPEYRFFATALALQNQTGGGLSETLENLAEVIRKRVALRSRALALASEARTSIFILASLPVVAALALAVLNPDYIALLFTTDAGKATFAAAIIMLGVGIGSMQAIIKKSLS